MSSPPTSCSRSGDEIAVRLLDFGLAQFDGADTLTAAGDVPGTLAYIAPERLAGDEATPESDVWAVGVLLWEALAGRHPFWGVPLQEVARAIEAGAPPLGAERRDLPRRLLAAVDGALARAPERRPRASALASELRTCDSEDPPRPAQDAVPGERPLPQQAHGSSPTPFRSGRAGRAGRCLGATLLPFWPPALVAAITLVAALAAWLNPRAGLAVALAAPIFPLGNVAEGAAVLYGLLALGWLAVSWRTPAGDCCSWPGRCSPRWGCSRSCHWSPNWREEPPAAPRRRCSRPWRLPPSPEFLARRSSADRCLRGRVQRLTSGLGAARSPPGSGRLRSSIRLSSSELWRSASRPQSCRGSGGVRGMACSCSEPCSPPDP